MYTEMPGASLLHMLVAICGVSYLLYLQEAGGLRLFFVVDGPDHNCTYALHLFGLTVKGLIDYLL